MMASNKDVVKSLNLQLGAGFEKYTHPYFRFYYSLFTTFDKGILPFSGSPVDQPNKIMEIFDVFQALQLEDQRIEHEKAKQQESKRKR